MFKQDLVDVRPLKLYVEVYLEGIDIDDSVDVLLTHVRVDGDSITHVYSEDLGELEETIRVVYADGVPEDFNFSYEDVSKNPSVFIDEWFDCIVCGPAKIDVNDGSFLELVYDDDEIAEELAKFLTVDA